MNNQTDTQDTYPPLPKGEQMASGLIGGKFVQLIRYSEDDLRAYVDADRTLRAGTPVACERDLLDACRRALEVIAVGDSKDPVRDAGDELVALGFWRQEALDGHRSTLPQTTGDRS